jgi:hypothetical protein
MPIHIISHHNTPVPKYLFSHHRINPHPP